ncbi:MAG: S8 family serine peptidase, partial [Gemmatimonadetes bacterium]|nr:S8 family serine peptidase [Gemmatimonadota bacterium]
MYRIPHPTTAIAGVLLLALASILSVTTVLAADLAAHVPGEILIKFTESTGASQKIGALDSFGATVLREDRTLNYSRVQIPDGMMVEEAIEHFQRDANVKWVEPNYYGWLPGAPQDPHITDDVPPTTPNAWHVFQTNLFHLWRWAGGGADTVRVGIIDSGTDLSHADLAGNAAASGHYDFVEGDATPNDPNGHGTHVAGIACAVSNTVGMAGVAYEAEFVSIRVMNAAGTGTSDNAAQGINWAADSTDVEVINMSIGFPENNAMYEAVANVLSAGIIPVAASGNDTASAVGFPANIPGVISVGATASDTT